MQNRHFSVELNQTHSNLISSYTQALDIFYKANTTEWHELLDFTSLMAVQSTSNSTENSQHDPCQSGPSLEVALIDDLEFNIISDLAAINGQPGTPVSDLEGLDESYESDAKQGGLTPLLPDTFLESGVTFADIFQVSRIAPSVSGLRYFPILLPRKHNLPGSCGTAGSESSSGFAQKKPRLSVLEPLNHEVSEQPLVLMKKKSPWDFLEECTLIGVVFTVFLLNGTLAFRRPVGSGRQHSDKSNASLTERISRRVKAIADPSWDHIQILFKHARDKQLRLGMFANTIPCERSTIGLRRRFKNMKSDAKEHTISMKQMFDKWRLEVNRNDRLLTVSKCLEVVYGIKSFSPNKTEEEMSENMFLIEEQVCLLGSVIQKLFLTGTLFSTEWHQVAELFQDSLNSGNHTIDFNEERHSETNLELQFRIIRSRLLSNLCLCMDGENHGDILYFLKLYDQWSRQYS